MLLFERLSAHWCELRHHLRDDRDVAPEQTVALRELDSAGAEVALAQTKALLDMELAGSGSLNSRGTQLAGLTGATIALVATVAEKWLGEIDGDTRTWITILVVAAMIALFMAMYFAVFAVLPTSRWRGELEQALHQDLAVDNGAASHEDLQRELAQRYLSMAEHQRVRNHRKAQDMLLSYATLVLGVLALLIAAIIFVGSDRAASTTPKEADATPTATVAPTPSASSKPSSTPSATAGAKRPSGQRGLGGGSGRSASATP